mmetsp:Transcript_13273/g.33489  ORF Transcript_13273/g.33489 Transcript_13273/m.33489 type:complete len:260 (+) Transcript_13273:1104-1883(+)
MDRCDVRRRAHARPLRPARGGRAGHPGAPHRRGGGGPAAGRGLARLRAPDRVPRHPLGAGRGGGVRPLPAALGLGGLLPPRPEQPPRGGAGVAGALHRRPPPHCAGPAGVPPAAGSHRRRERGHAWRGQLRAGLAGLPHGRQVRGRAKPVAVRGVFARAGGDQDALPVRPRAAHLRPADRPRPPPEHRDPPPGKQEEEEEAKARPGRPQGKVQEEEERGERGGASKGKRAELRRGWRMYVNKDTIDVLIPILQVSFQFF